MSTNAHSEESADLLTVLEVARDKRVSVSAVRRWISVGVRGLKLPRVGAGTRVRVRRSDLEEWQTEVDRAMGHQPATRRQRTAEQQKKAAREAAERVKSRKW